MRRIVPIACWLAVLATSSGCMYAGVAASGEAAIIARNDMFLFGALRRVYVCQITERGLANCSAGETP